MNTLDVDALLEVIRCYFEANREHLSGVRAHAIQSHVPIAHQSQRPFGSPNVQIHSIDVGRPCAHRRRVWLDAGLVCADCGE